MLYDIFISHSSHDKSKVARPLSHALKQRGLTVWFDEEKLNVGDSIRRGIDQGLLKSRFGVVVVSPQYLQSEWTLKELDALFSKETQYPKSILPILHQMTIEDVKQTAPLLADRAFLSTQDDIDLLADKICQSIQSRSGTSNPTSITIVKPANTLSGFNIQQFIVILAAMSMLILAAWIMLANQKEPDEPNTKAVTIEGGVNVTGCVNIGNNSECSYTSFGGDKKQSITPVDSEENSQ